MARLIRITQITGRIRLRSGLHIGAGKDTVEIGGLDQPIIKNPLTREPYIPGSSLRGKMRSMLETSVFAEENPKTLDAILRGKPCDCGEPGCHACAIFGSHSANSMAGPSRLIVRDSPLAEDYRRLFQEGRLPMEVKSENSINRLSGTAENPRPLERVPAGVCFDLALAMRVYKGDDPHLVDYVLKGLKLLELDSIGGGGSRGNGQIAIENLAVDGEPRSLVNVRF